ncbi:MAG: peptidylprolyl isomerase [Candidatus Andeanibacterium colombiense]|uniref:peptidylprolyl isomerase n=1 Tax=Candidatus Andeanibacterium colombiense TaxID=3121345 RepID=A0AAJ5X3Q7_9SPHN|nr:MAG: peptidylprolyl isomerase [Sphingomonadaceae bacterium]
MALKHLAALVALALAAPAFAQEATTPSAEPVREPATTNVVIETSLGPIVVALETERAPISSANFLRYADEHRLDGTTFYRVMRLWDPQPNGVIQGGPQGDPAKVLPPIAHEPTNLTGVHHTKGAISMARFEPGTATGDFSLLVSDVTGLDADPAATDPDLRAGYAAFGHIVSGMDVALAIFGAPIDPDKGDGFMKGQMIAQPVKILSVHREK